MNRFADRRIWSHKPVRNSVPIEMSTDGIADPVKVANCGLSK